MPVFCGHWVNISWANDGAFHVENFQVGVVLQEGSNALPMEQGRGNTKLFKGVWGGDDGILRGSLGDEFELFEVLTRGKEGVDGLGAELLGLQYVLKFFYFFICQIIMKNNNLKKDLKDVFNAQKRTIERLFIRFYHVLWEYIFLHRKFINR